MKKVATLVVLLAMSLLTRAQTNGPLKLVQTIPLPNVEGRIDHMGVDVDGKRLFVAALGNNSLEVVDLTKGERVQSVSGLSKPQGVYYVSKLKKVFVANGNDGTFRVFSGNPLQAAGTVQLSLGADLTDYDNGAKLLYVGHGGKDAGKDYGEFGIIDPTKNEHVGDVRTEAHPGGIAIESSGRVFVTLPEKNKVALLDTKMRSVVTTWDVPQTEQPVSLALDESGKRLFVGSRKPPKVAVFDTRSGKIVATWETIGMLDGIFYDAAHKRVYVSGGEGFLGVYQQQDADHYVEAARIPTRFMARTSLFVPALNRLFVALPRQDTKDAEIQVYEPQ
jgi:DNA-binding beta-propeller fold protein YncE